MTLSLTLEHIITLITVICGAFVSLWMRSINVQNKLFEQKTNLLEKEITEIKRTNEGLAKTADGLRDALQDTRENYVTNVRFEKFNDMMNRKLDEIMEKFDVILFKLDDKPDKRDCKENCK
jgi:hypothetical protein